MNSCLKDQNVEIVVHADTETVLSVDIPQFVVMEVIYSEPGLRGDTANKYPETGKSSEWRALLWFRCLLIPAIRSRLIPANKTYVERVKA